VFRYQKEKNAEEGVQQAC